jgi:3D (Asp-Asp-Asp) domain-containing protein
MQLSADGGASVPAGTILSIDGSSYQADEPVGLWVNVPDGTIVSNDSLGQTDTYVDGTVIPLNKMASTDDYGAFAYALDTSGLPNGNYSVVAHGLDSDVEAVLSFTIDGSMPAIDRLKAESDTSAVAAGTVLTIRGASYQADEPVGLWINIPDGTVISNDSLGQTDTQIDGTVIPLNAMAFADDTGEFTYSLNTSGLPSGNYSLVAHGLNSNMDNVLTFTIK